MKDTLAASFIAFGIGMLLGVFTTLSIIGQDHNNVTVRGIKDSFQTVVWEDKAYRLVPLDKAGKP
jgi:hypothetical protein